jgi:hypothetical protein
MRVRKAFLKMVYRGLRRKLYTEEPKANRLEVFALATVKKSVSCQGK